MPRAATKRTVVTRAFSSRTTRPSACEHTVIAQTRPCRGVLSHALNPPRYLICSGRVRIHTSSKRSAATIEDRNWSICLDEVGLCPRRSVAEKSPNDLPTPTGNSGNTQSPEERHLRISRRRTYGRCRSGDGREGGTRWVRAGNHDRTGVGGLFRCVRFFHASRTTVCVKLLKSQARLHYSSKFPERSPRPKRTATRFFFSGAPNWRQIASRCATRVLKFSCVRLYSITRDDFSSILLMSPVVEEKLRQIIQVRHARRMSPAGPCYDSLLCSSTSCRHD